MVDDPERAFPPTPLQLERARRQGHVPRSADLTAPLVMLGAVGGLWWLGPTMLRSMRGMLARSLALAGQADGAAAGAVIGPVLLAAGLCLGLAAVTALSQVVQFGPMFIPATARPDWRRVSMPGGLRRLGSGRSLVRAAMAVGKLLAAGLVLWRELPLLYGELSRWDGGAEQLTHLVGRAMVRVALWLGGALTVLGVLDWLYQRWQYRQDLRMTRRNWLDDQRQMNRRAARRGRQET
jgi:flagellar biosynthetic protein FlhB